MPAGPAGPGAPAGPAGPGGPWGPTVPPPDLVETTGEKLVTPPTRIATRKTPLTRLGILRAYLKHSSPAEDFGPFTSGTRGAVATRTKRPFARRTWIPTESAAFRALTTLRGAATGQTRPRSITPRLLPEVLVALRLTLSRVGWAQPTPTPPASNANPPSAHAASAYARNRLRSGIMRSGRTTYARRNARFPATATSRVSASWSRFLWSMCQRGPGGARSP